MKRALIAAGLAALLGTSAHAARYSPMSGERLLQACTARSSALVGACDAYLDGVSDTITTYQISRPADGSKGAKLPGYICVPGHMTGPQLREAVVGWGKQHRNELRAQASAIVVRALLQLYPCPK